jgi:hypothetical protein
MIPAEVIVEAVALLYYNTSCIPFILTITKTNGKFCGIRYNKGYTIKGTIPCASG